VSVQPAVVDSSGWIEVFTDGPKAGPFLDVLDAESTLVVPAISILEVFKWVLREHSEAQALQAVAAMQSGGCHAERWMPCRAVDAMQRGQVVNLDSSLAIAAAQLSHNLRLPMADSCTVGLPASSSTTKRKPPPAARASSAAEWIAAGTMGP
jgi:hypothetical protein